MIFPIILKILSQFYHIGVLYYNRQGLALTVVNVMLIIISSPNIFIMISFDFAPQVQAFGSGKSQAGRFFLIKNKSKVTKGGTPCTKYLSQTTSRKYGRY